MPIVHVILDGANIQIMIRFILFCVKISRMKCCLRPAWLLRSLLKVEVKEKRNVANRKTKPTFLIIGNRYFNYDNTFNTKRQAKLLAIMLTQTQVQWLTFSGSCLWWRIPITKAWHSIELAFDGELTRILTMPELMPFRGSETMAKTASDHEGSWEGAFELTLFCF